MARIKQLIQHLRCEDCSGYGFMPVTFALRSHQDGEETCRRCAGDGTKRERLRPVRGKLPKQRSMTLEQLEEKIRNLLPDRPFAFSLGFNDYDLADGIYKYHGYEWFSLDQDPPLLCCCR